MRKLKSTDCATYIVWVLQDISNVSPWSQITAQFNLFNSGSSNSSSPAASTAGRRLLERPDHLATAAAAAAVQAADSGYESSSGRSLLQSVNSSQAVNSSYPDYEAADTTTSDLTKEGEGFQATCYFAALLSLAES